MNEEGGDTMSEEVKEKATETATVDPKPTDEAMSTAFDKMTEKVTEKKEEIKQVQEQLEDEEPDQKERTRLGRRLKRMEDQFTQLMDKIDTLTPQKREQYYPPTEANVTGDDLPEYVATGQDVVKVLSMYEKKKAKEQEQYEQGYLQNFRKMGTKDGDYYEEIFSEMQQNFNVKHTGDPLVDSRINYAEAKAALMSKKVAPVKAKPNVRGERPSASADLSVSTRETTRATELPQLDDFAKEFISKTGMKEDSVKGALSGETPIHLAKVK
jgi:hypothetical protein